MVERTVEWSALSALNYGPVEYYEIEYLSPLATLLLVLVFPSPFEPHRPISKVSPSLLSVRPGNRIKDDLPVHRHHSRQLEVILLRE